jgi:hypothetical protein
LPSQTAAFYAQLRALDAAATLRVTEPWRSSKLKASA